MMLTKLFTYLIFLICTTSIGISGKYGEHKMLGETAFRLAVDSVKNGILATELVDSLLAEMKIIKKGENYYLLKRTYSQDSITYGDLTALSGDHSSDPFSLEDELLKSESILNQIRQKQNQYLNKGYLSAPDIELFNIDGNYLSLAINDLSHFYDYGSTLAQHIQSVNFADVENGFYSIFLLTDNETNFVNNRSPNYYRYRASKLFNQLKNTNAISKYIAIHSHSLFLAYQAYAAYATNHFKMCAGFLNSAILLNAFADHYLQDSFSAGHLVVNRSVFKSFTNNRDLHDFFGSIGLNVVNLNGDSWRCYGDGVMNKTIRHSYKDFVTSDIISDNYNQAIRANYLSILEIFQEFKLALDGNRDHIAYLIINLSEHHSNDSLTSFFKYRFKAISCIPLPFTTITDPNSSNYYDNNVFDRLPIGSRIGRAITYSNQIGFSKNKLYDIHFVGLSFRGFGIFDGYLKKERWYDLNMVYSRISNLTSREIGNHLFLEYRSFDYDFGYNNYGLIVGIDYRNLTVFPLFGIDYFISLGSATRDIAYLINKKYSGEFFYNWNIELVIDFKFALNPKNIALKKISPLISAGIKTDLNPIIDTLF